MADLYALTKDAMDRVSKAVLAHERRPGANDTRHRGRYPIGVGGSCPDRNEIHQLTVLGSPTGGTFDMDLTLNGVTETLTFNYDDTSTEVNTELETHSEAASGDFTVTGGPFPNATMQIEYIQNFAATAISLPTLDWGSLTGGTGMAVIPSRPQSGYPG